MNEVSLDPRQAPARDERLLAADFGRQARGRPIHGRLESEDGGAGEPDTHPHHGRLQRRPHLHGPRQRGRRAARANFAATSVTTPS